MCGLLLLSQVFGHGDQISGIKITDFGLSQSLENGVHEIAPTADGTRSVLLTSKAGVAGFARCCVLLEVWIVAMKHLVSVFTASPKQLVQS